MSSPAALVRRMFTEMVEAKDATVIGDFYHHLLWAGPGPFDVPGVA